ncbi:MAG: hypothetical protein ACO1QS_19500 [Verrucomicrobiota bacterium]
MIDWNIQSRAHHCQACQQKFADKQSYHTVLCDEKHEYQRMDVCDKCWQEQFATGAKERKGFISHWQGVYHAPPAHAPEAIQKDTAESLLRKLLEQNDPKYMAASYILAVMLERKRLLKIQSQHRLDGKRVFVYEQPKTGDIFTIPDPDLQLDQLQQVQHDVATLLEHGLPGSEPAPALPSVTTETPATDPIEETMAEDEPPLKSSGEGPAFVIEVTGDPQQPPVADKS